MTRVVVLFLAAGGARSICIPPKQQKDVSSHHEMMYLPKPTDGTYTPHGGLRSGQALGVCSMAGHDTKTRDAPQARNVSS